MKTPLQEGQSLADRYIDDWEKAETDEEREEIDNSILEVRDKEHIRTLLFCTGGPHLELALVYNEEMILFAVWTYKDWGTCDRWIASESDMEQIEKLWGHLPEFI